jgi:glutathione S-transferase
MTITVYGIAMSRASRVHWMLQELGLAHETAPVSFLDGSNRKADYLAINPNGRIPAIDIDGFRMFESLAINLHLARRFGGPLAPATLEEDGLATQWSFWALSEIERRLMTVMANRKVFRVEDRDHEEERSERERLTRPFAVLEQHLSSRDFLVGDRFTVADLNVASVMSMARLADLPLADYPRLDAWLTRCLDRPLSQWRLARLPEGLPRPPDWTLR